MALSFDSGDGCILSVDSHRVVPAPFLTKTYQLVDDPVTNEIVSWGEDGSTFVVWRPPEFARDLLPNYFKHNNFSSFVRQLNTYGFRKVVPDRWEFANDFFRKGERHLLCEIHRRKAQQTLSHLQHYSSSLSPSTSCEDPQLACTPGTWSPLSSSPLHSPRGLCPPAANVPSAPVSLSDENERLRRDNCLLLSELARLQKLYDDALVFLQQNMRPCADDLRLNYKQQQFPLQRQHLQQPHESSLDSQQRIQFGGNKTVGVTDGVAPKASTIDFVDGKLRELNAVHTSASTKSAGLTNRNGNVLPAVEENEQADVKPGPKLFGVVLHGRKRLHPDQQASEGDSVSPFPSSKSAKVELELMPPPGGAAAPWLGFRASRDERVCI